MDPEGAEFIKHIPAFKKNHSFMAINAWNFHKAMLFTYSPHFFLSTRFTNERKHQNPRFSRAQVYQWKKIKIPAISGAPGLLMKENIKIPEEQLPKMAGAEKRILKKALRAETIVSLPPLASSDDI